MARRAAVWLLAGTALLAATTGGGARAEEPPAVKAEDAATKARKVLKARRLLESSLWLEQTKAGILGSMEEREGAGWVPEGTAGAFAAAADWNGLLDLAAAAWASELDEESIDAGISFYESDPGKRLAAAQPRLAVGGASFVKMWTAATLARAAAGEEGIGAKAKGLLGRLKGSGKPEDNEKAAAETLRKLQAAQASFRSLRVVDADGDGRGEAGTWMELSGAAVPRGGFSPASGDRAAGSDFSGPGSARGKPALDAGYGAVDGEGILEREGYLFRIFLPDDRPAGAGFVHETGPAEAPGLAGDSLRVGVDLSETVWMAYAWPKERGRTGTAAFFVGQEGAVLRSPNEAARWSGTGRAPRPSSALLGAGITSRPAAGTTARDGDRWE
jgi:hypothetical protein